MATVLLQAVGGALGGLIGGPFGAAVGSALGGALGGVVDSTVLTAIAGPRRLEGPRLSGFPGLSAQQGQPIPRLYGRARLGGQVIWMTRFVETARTTRSSGKFGISVSKTTEYTYFANVAFGLCEGPIACVRRVWADGKELDLSTLSMRVYSGSETQTADPLIIAKEGADKAPAYRGLAYVVFEKLPISRFGNRLPQMSFEVVKPVAGLAGMIKAVNLIPGATEFGYDTVPVVRLLGDGANASENRWQMSAATDFLASIDALTAICPNLKTVHLIVAWFGNDLRAGSCSIRPGVDLLDKSTHGSTWSAGGVSRAGAMAVSQIDGRAAYGGTPSDASVVRAITELKARGLEVTLYPFVMMDVPAGNTLPNPWTVSAGQPAYPWRGRITCMPAPGQPSTVDGTAAAAMQVAAFFGSVTQAHFAVVGSAIVYSGPANQWSFRRHILHCAALAKASGATGFVIGSEMIGLTRIRDTAGAYPAVNELGTLLGEVRTMLGSSVKLTYAADWTEYGSHVRNNGADVSFPLDPLWADDNLDAIGIDYYPPISDWREGDSHLDLAETSVPHDRSYLMGRLASGEAFDWYYADTAGRDAQNRLPISDGAYGKPWIFRPKDLVGWWSNPHVNRVGGVETGATPFVPQGKPIWLTEIGCGAVDKGANQPNLFADPKSSENGFPWYSRRNRDDLIQANTLEAILTRFDPALPGHPAGANPVSSVFGGRMVDPERIAIWAYDVRPFPAFPTQQSAWGDAANWHSGHWLNGRMEGASLERLIANIAADYKLPEPVFRALDGFVEGFVIDRVLSARASLQPLLQLFGVEAVPEAGVMRFQGRRMPLAWTMAGTDLVAREKRPLLSRRRAEERALPKSLAVTYQDGLALYRSTSFTASRPGTFSDRQLSVDLPAVIEPGLLQRAAMRALGDAWQARETIETELPASMTCLEPGDEIRLECEGWERRFRLTRLGGGLARKAEAVEINPLLADHETGVHVDVSNVPGPKVVGPALVTIFDLPVPFGEPQALNRIGVQNTPWNGPMTLWRSKEGGSFDAVGEVVSPAAIGRTLTPFLPGPVWLWDRANTVDIALRNADLASFTDEQAFGGANTFAIGPPGGPFEIISAATISLIASGQYRLGRLLRGLNGTEDLASRILPANATIALVNETLAPLESDLDVIGTSIAYRLSPFGRDHGDPMAVAFNAEAGLVALRPLSPVHARARRMAGGVSIRFIRRTRTGGDNWALAEVPLSEETERYQTEILSGSTVKRTLLSSVPELLYTTAEEAADFGTPQTSLSLRIRQISTIAGPGEALSRIIPVT